MEEKEEGKRNGKGEEENVIKKELRNRKIMCWQRYRKI